LPALPGLAIYGKPSTLQQGRRLLHQSMIVGANLFDSFVKVHILTRLNETDAKGLNTEPHTFPFDLTCRSPERWEILEREAQVAVEELRKPASDKS
jgi:hypothetical protein